MKLLNRQYRGIDRATDVLSFPQTENRTQNFVLGDIVINLPRAKRQAAEQGITLNEELKRLMIHGLLHLIGYDHEKSRYQKNKMRSKERELLEVLTSL